MRMRSGVLLGTALLGAAIAGVAGQEGAEPADPANTRTCKVYGDVGTFRGVDSGTFYFEDTNGTITGWRHRDRSTNCQRVLTVLK